MQAWHQRNSLMHYLIAYAAIKLISHAVNLLLHLVVLLLLLCKLILVLLYFIITTFLVHASILSLVIL